MDEYYICVLDPHFNNFFWSFLYFRSLSMCVSFVVFSFLLFPLYLVVRCKIFTFFDFPFPFFNLLPFTSALFLCFFFFYLLCAAASQKRIRRLRFLIDQLSPRNCWCFQCLVVAKSLWLLCDAISYLLLLVIFTNLKCITIIFNKSLIAINFSST